LIDSAPSDGHSEPQSEGAATLHGLPEGVRTLRFSRFRGVGAGWLVLGIVATVVVSVALAGGLVYAGRELRGAPAPWLITVTVLISLIGMSLIAATWKIVTPLRVRRQLVAAQRWHPESTELAWLEAQRLSAHYSFFMSRGKRAAWVEQAHRRGVRVFMDERVSDWFTQAERTSEALEPETAASFMAQHEASFGVVAAMMGTMQLVGRNWAAAAVWILIGVFLLTRLLVRGRLFEPIIAGQGWLQNGRLRLSARDTVVTVRKQFGRTVSLTFTSPEGLLRLQLSMRPGKDQALRDLWARWTHPTPQDDRLAYDA
jgi:hypothetical protein